MDALAQGEITMDQEGVPMLYIVRAFGGQYDDSWSHNVAASTDEAKARAYVAAAEQHREACRVADEHMRQWSEQYRVEHPCPEGGDAAAWHVHMDEAYHHHFLTTFGQDLMEQTTEDCLDTCWTVDAVVAL